MSVTLSIWALDLIFQLCRRQSYGAWVLLEVSVWWRYQEKACLAFYIRPGGGLRLRWVGMRRGKNA